MGPMQYMVVGFEPPHFSPEVMPELRHLTRKGIIRVVDVLIVSRGRDGTVSGSELGDVLPDEDTTFIFSGVDDASEWFTQDDIDLVGTALPPGASVALLLFEHRWATRLDEAVQDVNKTPLPNGAQLGAVAAEIEHLLVMGSSAGATYTLPSRPA